ncbi:MAG: DUF4038 domain-containing protein [Clostridia bacterium]|nr:DUF4038 domain-containing protein [Clostridia bacterium]MBQ9210873.1 DUF4038 domain-containing protein [Clostridia bacterium]
MRQYETFELTFQGDTLSENWAQIDLTAEFTCWDITKTVRGFYDGEGRYIVRFLPEQAGTWHWKVTGCVEAEGEETCQKARDQHGLVKAVDTHFEYEDGQLFIPFGTTVYALASQEDALVEQTLASLKNAPFNKVRMCVFPKDYDYNKNEPPYYAFEKNTDGSWDTRRPNIPFWQRFESILDRIGEMGIQVDLILFHPYDRWGFAKMPQKDNLYYLDYLLRRFSAKPYIWWSLANEYDINMDAKSLTDWEEIEEYVAGHDPYHHLLSNHNCMCFWDHTRPNITHASLQTKALTEIPRWIREYQKPVVIDECCYEGNIQYLWGSISAQEMTRRFWRCYASGGYCTHGETFLSDDEILWWARGGQLKGQSPQRIAFLRQIMEDLPGPLTPSYGGLSAIAQMEEAELESALATLPEEMRHAMSLFGKSIHRMDLQNRSLHLAGEHTWEAHCGEEAYLTYCDLQCYGKQTLNLPENKTYRIELIDTWEMTQSVLQESASGATTVSLPAKEGMALLAIRIG